MSQLPDHIKAERAFLETPLGKLFHAFENAHGSAWQADTASGYADSASADMRADKAWEKQRIARAEFVAALMLLAPCYELPTGFDDPTRA